MPSDEDREYFYRRAEVELALAQRATSTPAVIAHVEMAERYMALCGARPGSANAALAGAR